MMQLQMEKLQAEVQKLGADAQYSQARAQSEMVEAQIKPQQIMSQMQSDMAKAKYNESLTKKLDLDYYNEIDGTTHNRVKDSVFELKKMVLILIHIILR